MQFLSFGFVKNNQLHLCRLQSNKLTNTNCVTDQKYVSSYFHCTG